MHKEQFNKPQNTLNEAHLGCREDYSHARSIYRDSLTSFFLSGGAYSMNIQYNALHANRNEISHNLTTTLNSACWTI